MKKKKGSTNICPKQHDKDSYAVKKSGDKLDEITYRVNCLQRDFASYRQYTSMKFQLIFVYLKGIANLCR